MTTIKITINYPEELNINGEYTARGPIEITWFPNVDLVIETAHEKIVFNSNTPPPGSLRESAAVPPSSAEGNYVITPYVADKNLEVVVGANLKLAKNDVARYVIIDDTFAFRLPSY